MQRISVLGMGYLGTTHAVCMAEIGHKVVGMDSDAEKIRLLASGGLPFFEPSLGELLRKHVATGNLRFTQSFEEVAHAADVHFICVGTPLAVDGRNTELGYLHDVVDGLAPFLKEHAVVVGKSTVPVGTAERLRSRLHAPPPADPGAELAWNPEFLREGSAVADTLRPDRIVLGVVSAHAERVLRLLYGPITSRGSHLLVTDLTTAELSKLAANAFLATKISFINAIAEVCEVIGTDVVDVVNALSRDGRIGGQFLSSGLGFGGGCLPKDLRSFISSVEDLGCGRSLELLAEVERINLRRRSRMVGLVLEQCGGTLTGRRVGLWGAAFKPNSDDVRDSPALAVAEAIRARGAEVTVYDPKANDNARKLYPSLHYVEDAVDAAVDADALVLATDWTEFQAIDPHVVGEVVRARRVIDGRRTLDRTRWGEAGWVYCGLGVG